MSFFGSIIVFIVLKRASGVPVEAVNGDALEAGTQPPPEQTAEAENEFGMEKWKLLLGAGKVMSLLALCATGALQPSALSVVYYLVFLGAATWWGCNKELERCEIFVSKFMSLTKNQRAFIFHSQSFRNCSANHERFYHRTPHDIPRLSKSLAAGVSRAKLNNSKVGDRLDL